MISIKILLFTETAITQKLIYLINQTYALVELPISSSAHGWVVPPVDFCDLISFDVRNLVHRNETRERNGQVVSQSQNLAALEI